jgi:hypothetical protein
MYPESDRHQNRPGQIQVLLDDVQLYCICKEQCTVIILHWWSGILVCYFAGFGLINVDFFCRGANIYGTVPYMVLVMIKAPCSLSDFYNFINKKHLVRATC